MNRRSQILIAAGSIPIAAALAAIGAILLIPPLAFGAFFIALTSQILARKKALSWPEIDWLYLESNETTHKQSVITVARWKDEQLIAEAGPQRSMQVLVRTPLAGGQASPMLQAIRMRATNALVGLDQLPAVRARRRGQPATLAPQSEPNVA